MTPRLLILKLRRCLNRLGISGFPQHALTKNVVGASLVAFAGLFKPGDYIGVEAHGDCLFYWPIKFAADGIFPRAQRELGDVGGVDLIVGKCGDCGELAFLPGSQGLTGRSFYFCFRILSCLRHKFSVQYASLFGRK
jgi:hypothetical protein